LSRRPPEGHEPAGIAADPLSRTSLRSAPRYSKVICHRLCPGSRKPSVRGQLHQEHLAELPPSPRGEHQNEAEGTLGGPLGDLPKSPAEFFEGTPLGFREFELWVRRHVAEVLFFELDPSQPDVVALVDLSHLGETTQHVDQTHVVHRRAART
jgi:hypothetical protein